MLYKDVEQGLVIVTSLLIFLTPVVYPPPGGYIGTLMHLNPLTPLFRVTRELLYGNVGSLTSFTLVFVGTLVVSVFCWACYRLAIPILVERLDA
jgi:lipopolysaccharide transport system permease protein